MQQGLIKKEEVLYREAFLMLIIVIFVTFLLSGCMPQASKYLVLKGANPII